MLMNSSCAQNTLKFWNDIVYDPKLALRIESSEEGDRLAGESSAASCWTHTCDVLLMSSWHQLGSCTICMCITYLLSAQNH